MKILKKSIALVSLSTVVLMSSCKQTQTLPLTLTGHNKVEFAGAGLKGIKGKIVVHIKNPNPVNVTVYKSDLDIKLNDMAIGRAKLNKRVVIPANSEIDEVLYLKPDFSKLGYFDIPKAIKTVQNKNVNFALKGNLKSGRYFNKTSNPVETNDTVDVKEKTKSAWAYISRVGKKSVKLFSKNTVQN